MVSEVLFEMLKFDIWFLNVKFFHPIMKKLFVAAVIVLGCISFVTITSLHDDPLSLSLPA